MNEQLEKLKVNFKKKSDKLTELITNLLKKYCSLDRKKRVSVISVAVLVFLILWAFVGANIITGNFNRSQVKNSQDEQKVDAAGIIITETKDGTKFFEIYGETGSYDNEENIATLYNVVGNFYKNNEVAMSFQSSKGTYNEKTGIVDLYENTYIVLKDNTSLESNRLTWSGSDKDTIAEGNVRIKKGNEMFALADKCIIGPDYQKFKIIGQTQTKIFKE